jgi:hypothetical protein
MGIDNILADKIMVELDEPRELIFSLKSFAMLSKKHGSVQAALEKFFNATEIKIMSEEYIEILCDMAYAGFAHYGKSFTPEMIDDAITAQNMCNLLVAITKAIAIATPKQEGDENPPKAV